MTSPVQNTWYNIGNKTIVLPKGSWYLGYETAVAQYVGATADHMLYITLSTTNNGESDPQRTAFVRANALQYFSATVAKTKPVTLTADTTFYLNEKTGTPSVIGIEVAKNSKTTITATCAYL